MRSTWALCFRECPCGAFRRHAGLLGSLWVGNRPGAARDQEHGWRRVYSPRANGDDLDSWQPIVDTVSAVRSLNHDVTGIILHDRSEAALASITDLNGQYVVRPSTWRIFHVLRVAISRLTSL